MNTGPAVSTKGSSFTTLNKEEAAALESGEQTTAAAAAALQHEVWANFPKDLIAGGLMGGVAHTIVAPIERAKLLLQTQESNMVIMQGKQRRYKGMLDCIFRIARDEGILSLWRGNGSSVMRYYPSLALNFAFKDLYRTILLAGKEKEDALSRAPMNFIAGAGAGCTSLVFVYPLDIAHTRLAADIGRREARQFKGLAHFMKTIYKRDGMRGLYKGLPASLQGMVVHRSVYFGGFDTAKEMMMRHDDGHGDGHGHDVHIVFWKRWMMAQVATTSAGLISYPLDTVRHRMMMQAGMMEKRMYLNTLDCWKKILKNEGVGSLYKGAVSNMLRGTGAALILVLYDELKYLMAESST